MRGKPAKTLTLSSIIPTSGASFKYIITDDGKVRNCKIVSEKQPEEWLDSFQTKALLPPPMKTRILAASLTAARSRMIATITGKCGKALLDQWQ